MEAKANVRLLQSELTESRLVSTTVSLSWHQCLVPATEKMPVLEDTHDLANGLQMGFLFDQCGQGGMIMATNVHT